MKTPTWALIVGICMLAFGGCHTSNRIMEVVMTNNGQFSSIMEEGEGEVNKEIALLDSLRSIPKDSLSEADNSKIEGMEELDLITGFAGSTRLFPGEEEMTWLGRFSIVGIIAGLLYFFGGLFLLMKKPFAIKFAYGAIGFMILVLLSKALVLKSLDEISVPSAIGVMALYLSIFIDLVLLVAVKTGDKFAYERPD